MSLRYLLSRSFGLRYDISRIEAQQREIRNMVQSALQEIRDLVERLVKNQAATAEMLEALVDRVNELSLKEEDKEEDNEEDNEEEEENEDEEKEDEDRENEEEEPEEPRRR